MNSESSFQGYFDQLSQQMATLLHHVAEVRSSNREIVRRLTSVEERLTSLEERLTSLEERLTSLEERLTSLEVRIASLEVRIASLEERVTSLDEHAISQDERLTLLERAVAALRPQLESDMSSLRQEMNDGFARVHERLEYLSGKVDYFVKLSERDRTYMHEYLYDRKAELTKLETRLVKVEERLERVEAASPGRA